MDRVHPDHRLDAVGGLGDDPHLAGAGMGDVLRLKPNPERLADEPDR